MSKKKTTDPVDQVKKEDPVDQTEYYKNKIQIVNAQLVELAGILDDTVNQIHDLTCGKARMMQMITGQQCRDIDEIFFDDQIDYECLERIHTFVKKYKGR